ncbi:hypothetical protein V6M93_20290 [Pectobacterium brasiliense]|uniref:hypothetical protein n=1 Tax=Pectobacterium brasiliense TaxID=180957 RepID=UPI003672DDAD
MKLYVEERLGPNKTGKKIYIDKVANTRKELEALIGSKEFYVENKKYHVSQVKAMKSAEGISLGVALGGILGLMGGVVGIAIGGIVGGIIGNDNDKKEEEKINNFNGSKL